MAQELKAIDEVKNTLMKMEPEFKSVLPSHIKPEKFIRAAQISVQMNPSLLECSKPSLYNACMKCATDGLIPDGREAAIVKMGGEAAYMPMIGGVLKLIRNSGELATIDAIVVHEKDEYDAWVDEKGPHFKFKQFRGDRGPAVLTFAYAITKDGHLYHEEVTEKEMADIKSKAKSQTVWGGPFSEQMKQKSALHRLAKRMPKSTDIEQVLNRDEDLYDLTDKPSVYEAEKPTTSSKLHNAVVSKQQQAPVIAQDAEIVTPKQPEQVKTEQQKKEPIKEEQKQNPADKHPEPAQNDGVVTLPDGTKKITGVLFEKLSQKSSEPGVTPKWTKFGGFANGKWYGTFSATDADFIQDSIKNRRLMNVTYTEKINGDKVFLNISSIEETTLNDAIKAKEGKEEVPF